MSFSISKNSLLLNCPMCRAPCPLAGRAALAPRVSAASLPSPGHFRPSRENLPAQAPATCAPPAAPLSKWCSNGRGGSQRSPFLKPRLLHRQHRALMLSEHSCQGAPLDSSIAGLPVKREYFSEGHSCILLDLTIQLNEGDPRLKRQFGSQRRLAGSAKPNQRDALPAQLFSRTEVPHQAEYHIFEAMIGEAFEESLDQPLFGRLFHLRGE